MPGNIPYIVVWSYRVEYNGGTHHVSEHATSHDFDWAREQYERVLSRDDTVEAHLCLPFQSTDHNTITVWA